MFEKIKKYFPKNTKSGQSMVEYILVLVGVILVLVIITGPEGPMTTSTDTSLDIAVTGVECMTAAICYDPDGCPEVCGNGCCGPGETVESCFQDCGCVTSADCSDANACNGVETCNAAGSCVPGVPLECPDDGKACNGAEICSPGAGCVRTDPLLCDDNDVCNGLETCVEPLGCQPGITLDCDDGEACNGVEICHPVAGCQAGVPKDCNDGLACNGSETCVEPGGCQAGIPMDCDDGLVCNGFEACVEPGGCQAGIPLPCNDGLFCNGVESCVEPGGCLPGTPPCDAINDCAIDCRFEVCDEALNTCVISPQDGCCDDGLSCNGVETCDPGLGCVAEGLDCPDCIGPDDVAIPEGTCRTYYLMEKCPPTDPPGMGCPSEERCCIDTDLSGSYLYPTSCEQTACPIDAPCSSVRDDGCGDGGIIECPSCLGCGPCPEGSYAEGSIQYCITPMGPPPQHGYWRHVGVIDWDDAWDDGLPPFDPVCQVSSVETEWKFEDATDCPAPEGGIIENGSSRTYYENYFVPPPGVCVSEERTCDFGILSGSFVHTECEVRFAYTCPAPEGGPDLEHLESRTYYLEDPVPPEEECESEVRTCDDGTLSGEYTEPECCVQTACPIEAACNTSEPDGCDGMIDCPVCYGCADCPAGSYVNPADDSLFYCVAPLGETGCWKWEESPVWFPAEYPPLDPTDPYCLVSITPMEWKFVPIGTPCN